MSDNILFDNIIITDDKLVAEQWAAETFDLKRNLADRDQVRNAFERLYITFTKYVEGSITFWEESNNRGTGSRGGAAGQTATKCFGHFTGW